MLHEIMANAAMIRDTMIPSFSFIFDLVKIQMRGLRFGNPRQTTELYGSR